MKAILTVIFVILVSLSQFTVYANNEFTFQELAADEELLIQKINIDNNIVNTRCIGALGLSRAYINYIDGGMYIVGRGDSSYSLPISISGEYICGTDCIWTGEYYYVRSSAMDGFWYDAAKYAVSLCLYDKDWNKVKEYILKDTYKQHPLKIGYTDGIYYCLLKEQWNNGTTESEKIIKSIDFEKWEETDQNVPQIFAQTTIWGEKMSFADNGFLPVLYEDKIKKEVYYTLGQWIVDIDRNGDFYFSNDNIYFYKIRYPETLKISDDANNYHYSVKAIYEYEDSVIIDMVRKWGDSTNNIGIVRLATDKNELYQQLYELKNKPRIQYQNYILAFETPPIIEEGRTLVPMRFLFEQMGADVVWNSKTKTATATLNDTAVTFAIDDIEATVNSQSVMMDVPARLVNGKTMVPLRFLSEELGYTVTWDDESRTAVIE